MKKTTLKIFITCLRATMLYVILFTATSVSFAQTQKKITKIKEFKNPSIEDYEQMVFEASEYLLSHPVDKSCAIFVSSCKIVSFWIHQDTGFGMPLGGNFYYKLRNNDNQQYFYAVSIVNYLLDQKINHNRILKCLPIKGQNYSEQEDVQEVRLKAAEIFLGFAKKRKNNIKLTLRSRKYLKHLRRGDLDEKFMEDLEDPPKKKETDSPFITYLRPE